MPTPSPTVVVLGSLNTDLIVRTHRFPRAGETVHGTNIREAPGGKSANQAVAAARLGAHTALIGALGVDHHAHLLMTSLEQAGVDISQVRQHPATPTGTAIVTVDDTGENTIIVSPGANALLHPEAIADSFAAFPQARYLCLCLESPLPTVIRAADLARQHRIRVVLNLSPYTDVPRALLTSVDILIVNEHEAAQLFSGTEDDLARDWDRALAPCRNLE